MLRLHPDRFEGKWMGKVESEESEGKEGEERVERVCAGAGGRTGQESGL